MTATYAERRAERLSKPCPRCPADVGQECRTPNGFATRQHKERDAAARGESPKPPKLGRLSDAQAQRIEIAAEVGSVVVPRWAPFDVHDRADITCVEKLTAKGLMVMVKESGNDRRYALTVAGWRVYRSHRLVIRRLSDDQINAGEAAAVAREQSNDKENWPMAFTDAEISTVQQALIAAGVTPERYMRAYWTAKPPAQPDDETQMTVRLYAYGTTTAEYDRAQWRQAVDDDELDYLIDHDASDLETNTLIVDGDGVIVEPYS